ncbi:MAG: response regulator [Bdellovibrionales bacterium]|nr:response regulator [Bdellovibrionales bacterium]
MLSLVLVLLVGAFIVAQLGRSYIYDEMFRSNRIRVNSIISSLSSSATHLAMRHDYSGIAYLVDEIINGNPEIVKMKVVAANGFVLTDYIRSDFQEYETRDYSRHIIFKTEKLLAVSLNWDISNINDQLDLFTYKFYFYLVLVMVVLGSLLYYLVYLFSVKPMRELLNRQHEDEQRLREAKEMAEKANTMKTEFFSTISHEIRTPMNSIIGIIDLLAEEKLNKYQVKYVQILQRTTDYLLQLINNLLDLSKIESSKITLNAERFDLLLVFSEVVEYMSVQAKRKNIDLALESSLPENVWVMGDRVRLLQVVTNLVSNAVKFTGEGRVHVSVLFSDINDSNASLSFVVEDTGIGIPTDNKEIIFEKFTQSDIFINRRFGGSGLGLAIAKEIVALMEGSISLESELGVGTVFKVVVPVQLTSGPTEDKHSLGSSEDASEKYLSRSLNILIVDDSEDNIYLMRNYFKDISCSIDTANNGQEACEKVKQQQFDVIFMDIQMPVMDGKSAAIEIRHWEQENGIDPQWIISLTAHAMQDEIEGFLCSGFDKHLSKPVRKYEVIEVIEQVRSNAK